MFLKNEIESEYLFVIKIHSQIENFNSTRTPFKNVSKRCPGSYETMTHR